MTASTGQLADNHDVISFEAYSDHEVMEKEDVERMSKNDIRLIKEGESTETNLKVSCLLYL